MAGLDKTTPSPTEIKLHQKSRVLEIAFSANIAAGKIQACLA